MNNNLKLISIKSLENATAQTRPAAQPVHGWLRAVREALGLSRSRIAATLNVSVPTIQNYEKREKTDSITLASMRKAAAAMDCELVLAIVPRDGRSFTELAADFDPEITNLRATEHSMTLENQGSGDLDQKIRAHLS
ncbi:MAG: hypothetical protein SynsKO_35590 [Synoicihabitans sp.]